MLKGPPSRNQRSKGLGVKRVLQICMLLTICIWLLYQLKRSHDSNSTIKKLSAEEMQNVHEIPNLGRKSLIGRAKETALEVNNRVEEKEEPENGDENNKDEESEDGVQSGDQEIDGNERDRAEEEEPGDIVNGDDRESYVKREMIEDAGFLGEIDQDEGKRDPIQE